VVADVAGKGHSVSHGLVPPEGETLPWETWLVDLLLRRQMDVLATPAPRLDATLAPGELALYAAGTPPMANAALESIAHRLPQHQPLVRKPHRGRYPIAPGLWSCGVVAVSPG
jgi:hypothetical protein